MARKESNKKIAAAIANLFGNIDPQDRPEAIENLQYLARLIRERIRWLTEKVAQSQGSKTVPVVAHTRAAIVKRNAAIVALSIYDAVTLVGKSIGDIWYHELAALRAESTFAAILAEQLIRHTIPNQPTKVRDMVSPDTLAKMIDIAATASGHQIKLPAPPAAEAAE